MATVSRTIEYPTSDGKPMAETEFHQKVMIDLIQILTRYYLDSPDTYVAGNMLLFPEEGNRKRHFSPDVFLVKGNLQTHPKELPDLGRGQSARPDRRGHLEVDPKRGPHEEVRAVPGRVGASPNTSCSTR